MLPARAGIVDSVDCTVAAGVIVVNVIGVAFTALNENVVAAAASRVITCTSLTPRANVCTSLPVPSNAVLGTTKLVALTPAPANAVAIAVTWFRLAFASLPLNAIENTLLPWNRTETLPAPNISGVESAFSISSASTVSAGDQKIGVVVKLPNEMVNVPLTIFALNVSRCTSLVSSRELGPDVTTPVVPPPKLMVSGETGTFCSAPLKITANGPPGAPITCTLPF